jgi:hypothetical protein
MESLNPDILLVALLAAAVAQAGCSGRQIYDSAYGWRVHECQKILDDAERARCMQTANTDYDTYKKQKDADQR